MWDWKVENALMLHKDGTLVSYVGAVSVSKDANAVKLISEVKQSEYNVKKSPNKQLR